MSTPKTFQYDDRVLDPAIRSHIATLYAAVDKEDTLDIWGQHFTEDAELKKGAFHVKGRENLIALTKKSWSTQSSRDHIVYAVFPFGPGADEVMLHGRSNNVSKEGEKSSFTWAARMKFRRVREEGKQKVLIEKYTIIPDYHPSSLS